MINLIVGNDILIEDLIYIELLRNKHPKIYNDLKENPRKFLKINNNGHSRVFYSIRIHKENEFKDLKSLLNDEKDLYSIRENEIEYIFELFNIMFSWTSPNRSNKTHLSICSSYSFIKYFQFGIKSGDFSEIEFLSLLNQTQEDVNNTIRQSVQIGKHSSLAIRFALNNEFESLTQYHIYLKSFFFLISNIYERKDDRFANYYGTYFNDLYDKIYPADYIMNLYNLNSDSEKAHNEFVLSIFRDPSINKCLLSEFINYINSTWDSDKPLTNENQITLYQEYLQSEMLKENNSDFIRIFFESRRTKRIYNQNNSSFKKEHYFDSSILKLAKQYLLKNLPETFIVLCVDKNRGGDGTVNVSNIGSQIFENFQELRTEILNSLIQSSDLLSREIIEFLNTIDAAKPSKPIIFSFSKNE